MAAIIFDGRAEAKKRELLVKEKVQELQFGPRLASVVFQEDAASQLYTKLKSQAAQRVGVEFDRVDVSMADDVKLLTGTIRRLSESKHIQGVMIQKPGKNTWMVNGHYGSDFGVWWKKLTNEIDPKKDVDCLSQVNLQKVMAGQWQILPATVAAVCRILYVVYREIPKKAKVTVIGRSEIVGKPLAAVLTQKGAEVTLCGSKTAHLAEVVQGADIVISATGVAGLIPGTWIKKDATVVDVGSPKGDVVFAEAVKQARFITPVPGGVGPMTVMSLLENLLDVLE